MIFKSVCWDITPRCNEDCLFCYREKQINETSLENNKLIIKNLITNNVGKISFLGGEPLLYKNLFELIDYAKTINTQTEFSITTNATMLVDFFDNNSYHINTELLKAIVDRFDWITFSLDAPNQVVQSKMGRNPHHVERILILLEELENTNIKIKINTVVSKINIDYLLEIYELLSKYSINRWKLFQFLPSRGNAKKNAKQLAINEQQFNNAVNSIEKISQIKITSNSYQDFIGTYITINPEGQLSVFNGTKYETVCDLYECDFQEIKKYINIERHAKKRSDYLLIEDVC